jgi:hypothetical protein
LASNDSFDSFWIHFDSFLLVYGALLGRQKGRHIELCTSFEMKMSQQESASAVGEGNEKNDIDQDIDLEFLNTNIGQCNIQSKR